MDKEIEEIYFRHVDMVYKICFTYLKNPADTEDAVQDVFIKLMKSKKTFNDYEHEKAWLIVTAGNTCKDMLKHWWNKTTSIDECNETWQEANFLSNGILEIILNLPKKYKMVLYLFYYEGYETAEIAGILNKKPQTVRALISKGRKLVKEKIEAESKKEMLIYGR